MCILKKYRNLLLMAFRILGKSFKGQFHNESDAVRSIKEEMMSGESDRRRDLEIRIHDRRSVEADIRKSFNKIISRND